MIPDVTVCVLTYNRPRYLVEAVRSILGQTWRNLRVVILDNASTADYREALCELSDERVTYHRHACNLGSWGNIIYACEHHRDSPYLMLFHDDDVMHPNLIEQQMALMASRPGIGWVSCLTESFQGATPPFTVGKIELISHYPTQASAVDAFVRGLPISFGAVLYRSKNIDLPAIRDLVERCSIIADRPMLLCSMGPAGSAVLMHRLLLYREHAAQDSWTGPLRAHHLIGLAMVYRNTLTGWWTLREAIRFNLWCAFRLPESYFRLPSADRPKFLEFAREGRKAGVLSWYFIPWYPLRLGLGVIRRSLLRIAGRRDKGRLNAAPPSARL